MFMSSFIDDYVADALSDVPVIPDCKSAGYHLGPSEYISSLDYDTLGDAYACSSCGIFYYEIDIPGDKLGLWRQTELR